MKNSPFVEECIGIVEAAKAEAITERNVRETLKRLRAEHKPQFENLFLKERAK